MLFIAYDIEGLAVTGDGWANYTMLLEVTDSAGNRVLPPPTEPKPTPREMSDFVPLRGNKLPARAYIAVGLDQAPGAYECKITVADAKTKAADTLSVKFEVAKKDFGVVAVFTSFDEDGRLSAPTTGTVGQRIFVHFSVASFERSQKTLQPDVELQFQIYDDRGAPVLEKPLKRIQDAQAARLVKPGEGAFPDVFPVFMNRPGKFVFEVTAKDRVSNKSASYKLPITVLAAPAK